MRSSPAGAHLPIVHVAGDATFTASHDLEAMMLHEDALTGPAAGPARHAT